MSSKNYVILWGGGEVIKSSNWITGGTKVKTAKRGSHNFGTLPRCKILKSLMVRPSPPCIKLVSRTKQTTEIVQIIAAIIAGIIAGIADCEL